MLTQAHDFRAESGTLYELLEPLSPSDWHRPTQFKAWTANDIVGHLHFFNLAAEATLRGKDAFFAFIADIVAARKRGIPGVQFTRVWLAGVEGPQLLASWREGYERVADIYCGLDPSLRVAWAGPDMSTRSCMSARQMETWSHGQALFDLLGRDRVEHDRLKNIAVISVNTFGWTFANRGRAVPEARPYVRLRSPSGACWEWHAESDTDRIEGSAVEFCRVTTQTRNVADTQLQVAGETAKQWLAHAQCFAGPPHPPPEPGTRYKQQ